MTIARPTNAAERRALSQSVDDTWAELAANSDRNAPQRNAELSAQVAEGRAALSQPNRRTRD